MKRLFFPLSIVNRQLSITFPYSRLTTHFKKGFTLVEAMVSMTILMIVLPIIYRSFIDTQKYLVSANVQSEIELENHTAMMNISKDIKESVIIFDRDLQGIEYFKTKFMADAVVDTQFTKKDGSEGSAILLMKYLGETKIQISGNEKSIGRYGIVSYYMTLLPYSSNFYTPSIKIRSIVKLKSAQTFIDQSLLNLSERDFIKSKGFLLWERSKRGFAPVLPDISQVTMIKSKVTFSTAPENMTIDGNTSSKAGGLKLVQNGNNVSITLLGIRKAADGVKSISLNSGATADSYLL